MRKTLNILLAMIALVSFSVLSSCSEDDALAKRIIIDGEKIALSHGYIKGAGVDFDNNNDLVALYTVVLTTDGLEAGEEEGDVPVGEGTMILMQLVSPTSLNLANGTYEINETFVKNAAFSFSLYNLDTEAEDVEFQYDATSGNIKISKSGSTYKITFNLVMMDFDNENEVAVTGSYEGKLTEATFFGGPL